MTRWVVVTVCANGATGGPSSGPISGFVTSPPSGVASLAQAAQIGCLGGDGKCAPKVLIRVLRM